MRLHQSIRYAWYGSGRRWDDPRLQSIGCAIGGALFWYMGVKLPQDILDNPGLSALAGICLGAITGGIFVFLLRLGWWPIHNRILADGSVKNFISTTLESIMIPIYMMIAGVLLFVILFGGGATWLAVARSRQATPVESRINLSSPEATSSSLPGVVELSFEDKQYRVEARKFVLSDCTELHEAFFSAINTMLEENTDQERYLMLSQSYINFVNESDLNKKWLDLVQYLQQDIERIDPAIETSKIQSYLASYRSLIFIGKIAEYHAKNKTRFNHWKDVDRKTRDAYARLRNSTSRFLKEPVPDTYFIQKS